MAAEQKRDADGEYLSFRMQNDFFFKSCFELIQVYCNFLFHFGCNEVIAISYESALAVRVDTRTSERERAQTIDDFNLPRSF